MNLQTADMIYPPFLGACSSSRVDGPASRSRGTKRGMSILKEGHLEDDEARYLASYNHSALVQKRKEGALGFRPG